MKKILRNFSYGIDCVYITNEFHIYIIYIYTIVTYEIDCEIDYELKLHINIY